VCSIRVAAWSSAVLTCAGLAVFIVAAEPRGGHPIPAAHQWVEVLAAFGGAVVLMVILATSGSPRHRAGLYAASAAVVGALSATLLKTVVATLAHQGLVTVLTRWELYALLFSCVTSTLLVQAALHVGPLTISQPIMVVLNPIVSIWLSVWLFGEYFTGDPAVLLAASSGFAALMVGVVLLTRTAPQHDRAPVTRLG